MKCVKDLPKCDWNIQEMLQFGAVVMREVHRIKGKSLAPIYRCGLHSGFRKCCIRFFVNAWCPAHELVGDWRTPLPLTHNLGKSPHPNLTILARAFIAGYHQQFDGRGFQNVPCPACIHRPAVKIQSCWFPPGKTRCELMPPRKRKISRIVRENDDPKGAFVRWEDRLVDAP